ncbi:DNA-processing protein DprA [Bombella apis]|uniref:DNA-processing protein DprA n=1 Tax=Bombella apis TaxID=1785988 RepID=UPI0024A94D49|nr:DNA-processing protein DprA [Bombella apis]
MSDRNEPAALSEANLAATERLARLRLARTKGIGNATFSRLMGLYGTAEQAIAALPARARLSGRPAPAIPSASRMEDEIAWLGKRGGHHLLRSDPAYPRLLAGLPNAPVLLFTQGNTDLLSTPSLAIVGARKASNPALKLTEEFAAGLAEAGLTVVSGLARGVDGAAHRGALPSGRTIAALPGGLDITYPPEHAGLQAAIAQQGCLITEYPPGMPANARHFPRRNLLIAGLARGCLLVEAARRSGTLITARLAATFQRLLFAVPGFPGDPRSSGGNDLLKQNQAILVEQVQDILSALADTPSPDPGLAPWSRPPSRQPSLFTPTEKVPTAPPAAPRKAPAASQSLPESDEKNILSLLAHTPSTVDEIASRCQLSISAVAAILIELEMNGAVQRHDDGQITLPS